MSECPERTTSSFEEQVSVEDSVIKSLKTRVADPYDGAILYERSA